MPLRGFKVRKWDGHAEWAAEFHHSPAAEVGGRGARVGGRASGAGTQACRVLEPAGVLILQAREKFIAPFFGNPKSSQVYYEYH